MSLFAAAAAAAAAATAADVPPSGLLPPAALSGRGVVPPFLVPLGFLTAAPTPSRGVAFGEAFFLLGPLPSIALRGAAGLRLDFCVVPGGLFFGRVRWCLWWVWGVWGKI